MGLKKIYSLQSFIKKSVLITAFILSFAPLNAQEIFRVGDLNPYLSKYVGPFLLCIVVDWQLHLNSYLKYYLTVTCIHLV